MLWSLWHQGIKLELIRKQGVGVTLDLRHGVSAHTWYQIFQVQRLISVTSFELYSQKKHIPEGGYRQRDGKGISSRPSLWKRDLRKVLPNFLHHRPTSETTEWFREIGSPLLLRHYTSHLPSNVCLSLRRPPPHHLPLTTRGRGYWSGEIVYVSSYSCKDLHRRHQRLQLVWPPSPLRFLYVFFWRIDICLMSSVLRSFASPYFSMEPVQISDVYLLCPGTGRERVSTSVSYPFCHSVISCPHCPCPRLQYNGSMDRSETTNDRYTRLKN